MLLFIENFIVYLTRLRTILTLVKNLEELGIRPALHAKKSDWKFIIPFTGYTMSYEEEKHLHSRKRVKVPNGFSSNLSGYVKLKIVGYCSSKVMTVIYGTPLSFGFKRTFNGKKCVQTYN